MNISFVDTFMQKTEFPASAVSCVKKIVNHIPEDLDTLTTTFCQAYDCKAVEDTVAVLAERFGYSPYSIWLILIMAASETAIPHFRSEQYFWDTFTDLRYKATECFELHGIWGTFVPSWYPRFLRGEIVTLGRLQYDVQRWYGSTAITHMDVTVNPGEPMIFLHIPSSGEPFDKEARLQSYRMAVDYFQKPLLCVCDSWLLYPPYESVFSPTSNIADFRRDFFKLVHIQKIETFTLWNVVGPTYKQPPSEWPEKTSLQRAFKRYALNGGDFGSAIGLLYFDGKVLQT